MGAVGSGDVSQLFHAVDELRGASVSELELALEISDRLLLVYDDGRTLCDKPENVVKSGMIKDLYGLDDKMYRHVLNYIMANSI